jgi:lambda repressor-like predicted transcriptional regulator
MHTPAARKWRPIVERARASGLSMRTYAQQNGFNPNTLAWWNSRLGRDARPDEATFLELVPAPAVALCVHVGQVRVLVDGDTDLRLLRRVVEALA